MENDKNKCPLIYRGLFLLISAIVIRFIPTFLIRPFTDAGNKNIVALGFFIVVLLSIWVIRACICSYLYRFKFEKPPSMILLLLAAIFASIQFLSGSMIVSLFVREFFV